MNKRAVVLAALVAAVYFALRPPLYFYDGYIYRLWSFTPLQGINPHHLLWIPYQYLIRRAAEIFALSPTTTYFQAVSILTASINAGLLYCLLARYGKNTPLAFVTVLFVAFSPKFWLFTNQNLPYIPQATCFLMFLLTLSRLRNGVPSARVKVIWFLSLFLAIAMQEAMLLVTAAVTLYFLARPSGWKRSDVLRWGILFHGIVAVLYVSVALVAVRGQWKELGDWLTLYLRSQHHVHMKITQDVIQSCTGLVRSLVQTGWIENVAARKLRPNTIAWIYALVAFPGFIVGALYLSRRWKSFYDASDNLPALGVCLFSGVAWAVFVFFWEPTNYYWAFGFIPASVIAVFFLGKQSKTSRRAWMGAMALMTVFNVAFNIVDDKVSRSRFPELYLNKIRQETGRGGLFLVLRDYIFGEVDYGLLNDAVSLREEETSRSIFDDFVVAEQRGKTWDQDLKSLIDLKLQRGERVFISDLVLKPDYYKDLYAPDLLSTNEFENFSDLNGADIFRKVQTLLSNYRLIPSNLVLGTDQFIELRGRTPDDH